MRYLKLFEEFGLMYQPPKRREFNNEYHLNDFYFKVENGGPSQNAGGTEIGDITLKFMKDDEEVFIDFEVFQMASGDSGATCEDEITSKELGIELDGRGRVLDESLLDEIMDSYASGGGGEWNDMEYEVEDVSPRGVIEEGWLLITIYKDGKEEEVQFFVRQEAMGVGRTDEVEPENEEEMEKLERLGIEFNDEIQGELLRAYDDYSNFIRP
jgi:hypothetical protein